MTDLENVEKETYARLKELQPQVRDIYINIEKGKIVKKSLKTYQKMHPKPQPSLSPSKNIRFPISPQIQALVVKNILYEGSMI